MITIKQLKSDPDAELMGLQREGYSVFPGCTTSFEIPLKNGSPYIGQDKPEYFTTIEKFETYYGKKFNTPEGIEWLKNYEIKINHDLMAYDLKNPEDEFALHVIKVNRGMGLIAISNSEIENIPVNTFKFIVSDDNKDLESRVSKKEIKVSAYTKLSELFDSNTGRLITVAKYLFPANSGIGNNKQLAFDKLEDFISKNTEQAEQFLRVVKQDPEYLSTVVDIKEAIFRGIIRKELDGQYALIANGTKLGRTEDDVIQYLMKYENKDLLGYGMDDDPSYSIKAQLKNAIY